jgi:DNA mismatch repair ATPase MutL
MKPSNDFKFKTEKREIPKELNKSEFTPAMPEVKRDVTQIKPAIAQTKADAAIDISQSQEDAFIKMIAKAKEVQEKETPSEESKPDNSDMLVMIDEALANDKYDEGRMNVRDSEVKRPVSEQEWNKCLDSYFDKKGPEKKEEKADSNLFTNGNFRVIGQLFETYILVEKENKLLLIDQHAAHERLNFESLKEEVKQNGVVSQMILEPVEIKLSGTEAAVYKENEALFAELGFECVMNENETVVISSVPGDISWSEIEPLFLELLTQVSDLKQQVIAADKERLLYTISCKASVKANMVMSEIEMTSLAQRVFRLENINTCPHGRPIVISMTKTEIEKQFRRIV